VTRRLRPLLLTLVVAVGACSFGANPYLPAANATPLAVLTAYLAAYKDGQCEFARRLWITAMRQVGDGDLCGDAHLTEYQINPEPAAAAPDRVEFYTTLTTTGSNDGSVEPGETGWFFELGRQSDGTWRILQGGSGP
jgi:hypothetical protein